MSFAFVSGDELALAKDVTVNRLEKIRARQAGLQIGRHVERVDDEVIVMHFAGRRRRTAVDWTAKSRHALSRSGNLFRHRLIGLERNRFGQPVRVRWKDRKSTRLNSSHVSIS